MMRIRGRSIGWIPTTAVMVGALACDAPLRGGDSEKAADSVFAFSNYLGGSADDSARDVFVDQAGAIYVAGGTTSPDFPVTAGVFGKTFKSSGTEQDAYIAKFRADGSVIWATLLSSPGYDRVYGIEVDRAGYVYVAGRAGEGFPVTPGAFQTTFAGGVDAAPYGRQDGFVCKITPDGSSIVFCSYFGDRDTPPIRDIALDSAGDIHVIASTQFGEFPAEWFAHAYQKKIRGERDLVIAKIANDGSRVLWATYLGGSGMEFNTASIRADAEGNSYVMTTTQSNDAPVSGGFDATLSGRSDIYVAKVSADGSRLLWGSYYGGSDRDFTETHELALDASGNAVIAAMTTSADLPVTPGAVQPTYGGSAARKAVGAGTNYSGDAFVAKISADGTRLMAATYLGGSGGDGIEGVSIDGQGNIYVSGGTYSKDLRVTTSAPIGPGKETDFFAAKLTPDLTRTLFSVQYGGDGNDAPRSSFVDHNGNMYVVGETSSKQMPGPRRSRSALRGSWDAAVARLIIP